MYIAHQLLIAGWCIHGHPICNAWQGYHLICSAEVAAVCAITQTRVSCCVRYVLTYLCMQETGRVVKHIEMWDVEPGKVLKRLLKPAARTPSSRWETLMLSLHEGDVKGVWLAASAPILKYSAPVVGISLITKVLTGHGLPVSLISLA